MDVRKKLVIGILVISIFIFLVTVLVFVYALSSTGESVPSIFEPFLMYHLHFMVIMGVFGVLSGLVVYSILNSTLEKQKKVVQTNISIIMKFLSPQDREIVHLLTEKDGMTTQSEIAKLPGMSRLKAHRVVKKLEDSGIIHIEKYGKINMIRIVDELRDVK
ncbi:MAG: winged helix-turn-helix transcriptional regulator [Candidatus Micrarchaeota archaeon]|nr:winged helix-turn-helix transcriptional regulator [Candidatus Micrarchaeota archaeon]